MASISPVQISVDLSSMRAHVYNISINLSQAFKKQKFMLPCWTPGSYLIREFSQHIMSVKAYENNSEINVSKINKNTFELDNISENIEIKYQVYAFDSSIRAAFIDDTQAFFNGSSLFLCPLGHENSAFSLSILKPVDEHCAHWQLATGMPVQEPGPQGFGIYGAMSYEELIDYPFQIGVFKRLSFSAASIAHEMVLVGDIRNFDEERLKHDLQAICESQINIFKNKVPFINYLFIARFEENGHGGLEHRNSTMVLSSPYVLPEPGMGEPDAHYRGFLSLCSHEYFHAWNIKSLKPKSFVPFDLNKECYTTMLWQFEGTTSYYDDFVLRKAKLISAESYLEILAKNYGRLLKNKGRFTQSLAQASFDAWIKFYRPNENSQNAAVSYYLKGSFVALLLDLMIRAHTSQEKSLDNVMSVAYEKYGQSGIEEHELFTLLAEFGVNTHEFKERYIYGTDELPMADWLSRFGVDFVLSADEQSIDDKTKVPAYWGFKLRFCDHHRAIINFVDKEGPAMLAGLSPHDEIVAVNNVRLDPANMADLLGAIKPGTSCNVLIARKKVLRSRILVPENLLLNSCKITLRRDMSALEKEARMSWLGQ